MPSRAFQQYDKNLNQVNKLLEAYDNSTTGNRGRQHLDHFTRAALIFLCSSFEIYIEEFTKEVGNLYTLRFDSPKKLPKTVKTLLTSTCKNPHGEGEDAISLATDWRVYFTNILVKKTDSMNTPKKGKIIDLFKDCLGVNEKELIDNIKNLSEIDKIISNRGQIAHTLYSDNYLRKQDVEDSKITINSVVKDIDRFFWEYIPVMKNSNNIKRPWQNTYSQYFD